MKRSALKSVILAVTMRSATCLSVQAAPAYSPVQTSRDTTKRSKMKKGKKMKMKRDTAGTRAKQDSVR